MSDQTFPAQQQEPPGLPAFVFLASHVTGSYVSGTVLGVTGGKPVF